MQIKVKGKIANVIKIYRTYGIALFSEDEEVLREMLKTMDQVLKLNRIKINIIKQNDVFGEKYQE